MEKPRNRGLRFHRVVDHLIGSPALWMLGMLRRRRSIPTKIRRVVLLQSAALGDTLLMGQGIRRLREALPDAHIIMAVGPDNRGCVELLPKVDEFIVVNVLSPLSTLKALRALKPDLLIDYGTWPRINALLTALAGARLTVGFKTPGQNRHFAFDITVDHSSQVHEVENQRALLGFLGPAPEWDVSLQFPPPPSFVPPIPANRFVVFHAWASATLKRHKEWPMENWVELGQFVADQSLGIILTGGPGDSADATQLLELIRAQVGDRVPVISVAGSYTLAQTAYLLQASRAVVSVNTGIMHLAALLGVPTIALNGPTNPSRWGPYGPSTISLVPDKGTFGFMHLGFEHPPVVKPCLQYLPPSRVASALSKWLGNQYDQSVSVRL